MANAAVVPMLDGGVLVASPNPALREQIRKSLDTHACAVHEVNGGADALVKLESGDWQLLFLDQRLPDLDAEEVIQIIKVRFPGIEVVLLDSSGAMPHVAGGRFRSWLKPSVPMQAHPCQTPRLLKTSESSREICSLPGMIGSSECMQELYRLTRLVAPRATTVLILGATGTGKELVARAIHQLSPRCKGPLVIVNCAAIPESLLESELFGFSRGAFTGAVQAYAGRIQSAQGGTLFLDEIGEMPLGLQAKLLRFLEQKEVQRLGSCDSIRVDVRVIAATNAALEQLVEGGRFREDLYYRLSAFPLQLPPLSQRKEDIAPLAQHFLRTAATLPALPALSPDAARRLEAHSWPGNVRELQQVIERAAILAGGQSKISSQHLHFFAVPRVPGREREKPAQWTSL